ncbi:MAG: hypothetical protein CL916_10105 [Deltaproteobacteria bacterium]|nr:hypothetical protein [Deltaproteobacteria bacterium]
MNFRSTAREEVRIELTPLIDIIFQLVLFFMVSTTFDEDPAIDIALPESSSEQVVSKDVSTEIWIDKKGVILVDQLSVSSAELESMVQQKLKINQELLIIVNADQNVEHQKVVSLIDELQQIGVKNISIGTENTP